MRSEPGPPVADGGDPLTAVLVSAIVVVVLLLAVVTLGSAPLGGEEFEITADPAANLPF